MIRNNRDNAPLRQRQRSARAAPAGNSGTGREISRGANDPQSDSGAEVGTKLSGDVPDGVVQEARTKKVTGRRT